MRKVLFLDEVEKGRMSSEINHQLKMKNNLLRVLYENDDHKLSRMEFRKLVNKYEEQIYLLENIRRSIEAAKGREDIRELNHLIDYYHSLDT